MAGDWIKMRTTIRRDPKVVAMSRFLSQQRLFMDWWSDPQRQKCSKSVTEVVTSHNVTRVTVCALLEVWGAVNGSLSGDLIEGMAIDDIDEICGIPCFGEAMLSVGWVEDCERRNGLVFPNFREHNIPDKERSKAKSGAERTAEWRRKKQAKSSVTDVTFCDAREEKRREEKNSKKSKPKVGSVDLNKSKINEVLTHYKTHQPTKRPGDKDRSKINARLNDGYSVDELKSAIDGNHKSPWHCGDNDEGKEWHALDLIFRDSGKVDEFIAHNNAKPRGKIELPQLPDDFRPRGMMEDDQ